MERTDRGKDPQLLRNQPYDESLDVEDGEEVPSVYSPTPRGQRQVPGHSLLSCPLLNLEAGSLKLRVLEKINFIISPLENCAK